MFDLYKEDGGFYSSLYWYVDEYTLYTSTWTFSNSTTFQPPFYPTDWVRICLSIEATTGMVVLIIDGEILHEGIQNEVVDASELGKVKIELGGYLTLEDSHTVSNVNIFSGGLSTARMVEMTLSSSEACGAAGDVLSWEEAHWNITGEARRKELKHIDGPCGMGPSHVSYN